MSAHTWEQILNVITMRRTHDAPTIRRMVDTRDHYNGDITIPLVNVEGQPEMNVLMPFKVADGIEGTAMRAAGPMPNIHVPALNQMKETGKHSIEYAATRRRALYGRWHRSAMSILLGRAYRQLVGYGTFSMLVVPDMDGDEDDGARVVFRDALGCYPSLRAPEDLSEPEDVGYVSGRSPESLMAQYPEARDIIDGWQRDHPQESMWDIVEWIDDTDIVIGLLGPRSLYATDVDTNINGTIPMQQSGLELRRIPNRAGMVPAVVPRRITLDRIAGQLEKIIPMEEWAAKLMALDFIAAERGVFPDMVVLGEDGRTPQIVGSAGWNDGRSGLPNLLQNVKGVQNLQMAPGPMTTQTLDRLERNMSVSGGVSPMFGGEQIGTSMRTGRGLDAMGGYSIDPRIQEVQIIMAYALGTVNKAIIEVEKGYFGARKFSMFSGWPSDRGIIEYTPNKHFESNENVVSYTFPGSDISQITVAVSQLNGAGLMSKHTARDKHPYIEDAEMEERLLIEEQIDGAVIVALEQQVAGGQIALTDVAEMKKRVAGGMTWPDAILEVQVVAQERQAQQAQAQMAQQQAAVAGGAPDMTMGPASQPGLGGGPAPAASVAPPAQGLVNVASMVRAIGAGPAAAHKNPMPA